VSISESQKEIERLTSENLQQKEQIENLTSTLSSRETQLCKALQNSQSLSEQIAKLSRSDLELRKAEELARSAAQMKIDAEKKLSAAEELRQQIEAQNKNLIAKATEAMRSRDQAEERARVAYVAAKQDIERACKDRLARIENLEMICSAREQKIRDRERAFAMLEANVEAEKKLAVKAALKPIIKRFASKVSARKKRNDARLAVALAELDKKNQTRHLLYQTKVVGQWVSNKTLLSYAVAATVICAIQGLFTRFRNPLDWPYFALMTIQSWWDDHGWWDIIAIIFCTFMWIAAIGGTVFISKELWREYRLKFIVCVGLVVGVIIYLAR